MTPALSVENLSFEFSPGVLALRSLSFEVEAGECAAVIGPNGAGKSTLLLHLNGILPERAGTRDNGCVRVHGRVVNASEAGWVRRQVGVLFQDPDDQLFCPTVGEDVAYGPEQLGYPRAEIEHRVARALRQVGLAGFEARVPQQLSGGEKKRVCLAGLLAYDPSILVLDEPSAGLDPRARRELIAILSSLPVTRVIATHDLALVAELCSRALLLDAGVLVASGPSKELLRDDELMRVHGMECPSRDLPAQLLAT
ncbi:MAG TPA: energy-coupling factor ABC transporter ATP-binding protein [Polyangiaceae bacterium]|nr:energy-coupling factor ABC transporter ATP-binding protein [Polyangiaceae bacterium]